MCGTMQRVRKHDAAPFVSGGAPAKGNRTLRRAVYVGALGMGLWACGSSRTTPSSPPSDGGAHDSAGSVDPGRDGSSPGAVDGGAPDSPGPPVDGSAADALVRRARRQRDTRCRLRRPAWSGQCRGAGRRPRWQRTRGRPRDRRRPAHADGLDGPIRGERRGAVRSWSSPTQLRTETAPSSSRG